MSITRNALIEQLWYTWSTAGYGSTNGFRIRKVSAGLDVNSARVKSMDRFLRYALPTGYDSFSTSPEQAPISLSLLKTDSERVLIYKTYRGKDLVGRPGNFFAHLLAGLPDTLTARDAIDLWRSNFWQVTDTNDQEVSMRTTSGDELARASRVPIDLSTLQEPLTSLILAYLTRQPEQRIYLIADSSDIVAALISGLTRSLPEQLLRGLTFSTYESDVTRAPMQIVGTCLRTLSERDARAEQTILAHCRREGLLLDCRRPGNSSPLEQDTLAARFAKYAAESVADNDSDQLNELYAQMQQQTQITVYELLDEYKHIVEDAQQLSPEQIEFYLNHERYALQKLNDPRMRDAIIDFLIADPTWWRRSLKSILQRLKMQNAQFNYPLSRLAKRGVRIAVEKMQTPASAQDEVVLETMLDLIRTLEPPALASEVWTSFLQQVASNLQTLQFLFQHWTYTSHLLTTWSSVQPHQGAFDEQIRPLLWIQWPNYEQLLQLPIPLVWKALATDQLLNDATQKLDDRNISAGAQQAIEEVLTLLINTPSWWTTATNLIILLTGQRFLFSKSGFSLILKHFQQILENRQYWNEAMNLRNALVLHHIYTTEDVLYEVLRSSTGKERAQEQADNLLQTTQERAAFLEKQGPKLLTYVHPATTDMVITQFGKLALENYPERMKLLFPLLDKLPDTRVIDLLNVARLNHSEAASVLKSYGKRYLHSPIVSPVILGLFDELGRRGYPHRIEILSELFQPEIPPATLEDMLAYTHLSTVEDYIALYTHIGTWYITQHPRSPTMVRMLEILTSYNYSKKMELVFAWLQAPLDDGLLDDILQRAHLSREEHVAVLNKYAYIYLSPPRSSRVMLDLCIKTLGMQPSNKLALVSTILSLQIGEADINRVLEAANLVIANGGSNAAIQEIKELFEQHGSQFLPSILHSPTLQHYINVYLQFFTFDDLTRPPARELIHTLYHALYNNSPERERLLAWYTISHYLKQPTDADLKDFLKQVFKYGTPINVSGVFYTWLVQMCHTLTFVSPSTKMSDLILAVNSAFKGLDHQGLDKVQLLYAMADCAAQDYQHSHMINVLLPYIYSLPQAQQACAIPSEKREYFTVALLNTLLSYITPEILESLNERLAISPLAEWQTYYDRSKDRLTEAQTAATSSSFPGRVKDFLAYRAARRHLWWALLWRKPHAIATAWNANRVMLEKHHYKLKEKDHLYIEQAEYFCNVCDKDEIDNIVFAYEKMCNERHFRFTKQEHKYYQSARNGTGTGPIEQPGTGNAIHGSSK